jgi:hypothetical protein
MCIQARQRLHLLPEGRDRNEGDDDAGTGFGGGGFGCILDGGGR